MPITRRQLFPWIIGSSATVAIGGVAAIAETNKELPKIPVGYRVCDAQGIGCGETFAYPLGTTALCPQCFYAYETPPLYYREQANRPSDDPIILTSELAMKYKEKYYAR